MKRLMRLSVAILSAVGCALLLVILPRLTLGLLSGSVCIPAFFMWWAIADTDRIPWWWVTLVLTTIDAVTFSPHGGLVLSFGIAWAILMLMNRILPPHRLPAVMLSIVIASLALRLSLSSILFGFATNGVRGFPWQSLWISAFSMSVLSVAGVAILWRFRISRRLSLGA